MKKSGRWPEPRSGSFKRMASPGRSVSTGCAASALRTAKDIAPMWPGEYGPCATILPIGSKTATEKSWPSRACSEYAVRWTVVPISTAIDWSAPQMTPSVIGSIRLMPAWSRRSGSRTRRPWPSRPAAGRSSTRALPRSPVRACHHDLARHRGILDDRDRLTAHRTVHAVEPGPVHRVEALDVRARDVALHLGGEEPDGRRPARGRREHDSRNPESLSEPAA